MFGLLLHRPRWTWDPLREVLRLASLLVPLGPTCIPLCRGHGDRRMVAISGKMMGQMGDQQRERERS